MTEHTERTRYYSDHELLLHVVCYVVLLICTACLLLIATAELGGSPPPVLRLPYYGERITLRAKVSGLSSLPTAPT